MKYNIYTDGGCRGNPGPGGWAFIVMDESGERIISKARRSSDHTTNNEMELSAILAAFQYAEDHPEDTFIIISDSAYAVNSCNTWIWNWAANGWVNSKKKTVENLELMRALYTYLRKDFFNCEVVKCNGHAGIEGNELADAYATANYKRYAELVEGYDLIDLSDPGLMDIIPFKGFD